MKQQIFSARMLLLEVLTAALLLPGGGASGAPITWVQERLTYDDTTIVKNDNVLNAIFPGSGATRVVNGVAFRGLGEHINGASYTNWDTGITLGWGPIATGGWMAFSLDTPTAFYENGGWGNKIMDNGIVSPQLQDGGEIPLIIDGLTIGENYRVQILMDWPVSHRTMEVRSGLESSGSFAVGGVAQGGPGEGVSMSAYFTADATSIDFRIVPAGEGYQRAVFNTLSISGGVDPPQGQAGDFDGDFDVDGNDFLLWQRGQSPGGVTLGDLAAWEANFGTLPPAAAAVGSVPEPSSIWLAGVGLLLLTKNTWRRGGTRPPAKSLGEEK